MKKYFELGLDIATGCRYDCTGCMVDRVTNTWPKQTDFDRFHSMVDTMEANGMEIADLILGPTDLMSAENSEQCLTDPEIIRLARRFDRVLFNVAFLAKDDAEYVRLAERINAMVPGGTICMVVPFEIKHLYNDKYIQKIRDRVALFASHLVDINLSKVFPTVNVDIRDKLALDAVKITDARVIKLHSYTNGDLVLPHGRHGFDTPEQIANFHESVDYLAGVIMQSTDLSVAEHQAGAKKPNPPFMNEFHPHEGMGIDSVFKNGKLYLRPFLIEPFTIFHERFRIKGEWTFDNIYMQREYRTIDGLEYASKHADCHDCILAPMCAERGAHAIMELSERKTCITGAKHHLHHYTWISKNGKEGVV